MADGRKYPERALTAIKVKNLRVPGKYADGNGLYLIVDPSGAKRWVLRTLVHGKRRHMGLGSVSLVSLAEARDAAVKWRRIARDGGDPIADREGARRITLTFEKAARQVHEEHSVSWRNPKHKAQWIHTLEQYAFPLFGAKQINHVDSADVLKALGSIWTSKPETARRVRQRIRTVFDWAKAAGFRVGMDNPVEGVSIALPRHSSKQTHFKSLPYADVPEFIQALRQHTGASPLAFEFLIVTATRTSEVLKAQWDEIDLDKQTWTIPAARMKAGVEHRVPLSVRSLEVLGAAHAMSDGGNYVFPGGTPKRPMSNMVFHALLRRMEWSHCTPHGFRSSFRDWAEERTNHPRSVTEAALAHQIKDKVEAAYRRTDLFEKRRKLMNQWAAFAVSMPGKVVRIGTGRS